MDAGATLEQKGHHGVNKTGYCDGAAIAPVSITNGKRQRKHKKGKKSKRESKAAAARHTTNKHNNNAKRQGVVDEDGKDARLTPQHIVCPVCMRESPNPLLDISSNVIMRQALSSYLDRPLQKLESPLSSVCMQCVYKINVHREMTRTLQIRLHRLTNGQIQSASQNHIKQRHKMDALGMESATENQYEREKEKCHEDACTITNNNVTNLASPEAIRALSVGNALRPTTLPLTADLSTPNTPETKGAYDVQRIDSRNGSLTPPPPPYSPLRPLSVERELAAIMGNCEAQPPPPTQTQSQVSGTEPQSPRVPYVVEVEDVTPVKDDEAAACATETNEVAAQLSIRSSRNDSITQVMQLMRSRSRSNSNSNHSGTLLNHSILKIICERSESALVTESGGKINNYQRAARTVIQLLCNHCGRSYVRKNYYTKHVRRCQAQRRRCVSVSTAGEIVRNSKSSEKVVAQNRTNGTVDSAISVEAPRHVARIFHCTECLVTTETQTELRRHKQTHYRQYNCETCDGKFSTAREHEFHRVICLAKDEVEKEKQLQQQEQQQVQTQRDINTSLEAKSTVPSRARSRTAPTTTSRCVTRAQSRARSQVTTTAVTAKTTTTTTTVTTKRRRTRVASSVSQYTSITSYTGVSGEDTITKGCSDLDDNDDEDLDDEVSAVDSMYSKRRCFTGNWVDSRGSSGSYNLPILKIDTWKQYDLYLLELLKAQIEANFFYCLEPGCCYIADNLLNLMLHDYINHFKSSWFYCQKCSSVFTSKVFLDYHLDRQNGGRFICYKCNEEFVFQHQLDWHLIHHNKSRNFACNSCNCEFLSELKLYQHVRNEHSNEMCNNTIRIESMIESTPRMHEEMKTERRAYQKCIRLLEGVEKMPSNRPMQLPGHKPYRRHIGVIEFTNEKNPNCWSWK